MVVADRAYLDFAWFHQLQARGVTFVTRLKRGVRYRVTHEHDVRAGTGILSDQTIELTSARSRKVYPPAATGRLPRPADNKSLRVRDQQHHVGRQDDRRPVQVPVADRAVRVKQHLKVKRFVGRSKNAVLTQLWVATCMYLLLAYLRPAVVLEPQPDAAGASTQRPASRRPLHDPFATRPRPSATRARLGLRLWDTSDIGLTRRTLRSPRTPCGRSRPAGAPGGGLARRRPPVPAPYVRRQKLNDTAKRRRLLATSGATVTRRAVPVDW